jgi:two-component system chemotaxis response regulator CheB
MTSAAAAEAPGPDRLIRVLVVDDSATVRAVLARRLDADPTLEVVGRAADGLEALELIAALRPDVVTLDIEMPRLDGLGTLERIMNEYPTRVVMVSSFTAEGADATIRALELGAVDFIEKPSFGGVAAPHAVVDEVSQKVRHAAGARLARLRPRPQRPAAVPPAPSGRESRWLPKKVLIGSSTGGPQALQQVLASLPADLGVPVVVVQHMPGGFTRSLAQRLDELSPLSVQEAAPGSRMEVGKVLLAPGGFHLTLDGDGVVALNEDEPECGVRPSINITAESLVRAFGGDVVAVVLTGMGNDGTRGAALIKEAGGSVIAEAEESCVVYGMPRSVVEAGYADRVVSLEGIAGALARACRATSAAPPR